MLIHKSLNDFSSTKETVITIGTFDGVHVGHKKIIEQLVQDAKKHNTESLLLTFFPHPRMVLQKDMDIKLINTIEEKASLLENLGLDHLIIHPFDKEFSRLTALEFVRNILVNKLHVSKLVIGYDHHFGKNREGSFEQLKEYSELYDFEIQEIPAQDIDHISVSSTKIRKALEDGDIKRANDYLGYSFMLHGKVVKGEQIGTTIGYPTANIEISEDYKLVPKNGVYIVQTFYKDQLYYGMMNIGKRPTVFGNHRTIEVHLFDFSENIYGENLKIELLHYLREEKKFEDIEQLKLQLEKDKTNSKRFLFS
ncbi:bifunctional riboflavin kinase/FAD synthetase [Aureivirga sp. CE67]|uniref:bifunctional riboflavin kinase/FAD synthetase n=1 Tax=Aureivirga sp. CE67 TaxID=1788983 RepID=UPI0018C91918|nr:bifunctional riboflavin kinase/FAD synthetase [Aureivirga sp. CE67]